MEILRVVPTIFIEVVGHIKRALTELAASYLGPRLRTDCLKDHPILMVLMMVMIWFLVIPLSLAL